jgi:hypothetical protein
MTASAYLFGGGFALMLVSLTVRRRQFALDLAKLGVTVFLVGVWGMYGFWPVGGRPIATVYLSAAALTVGRVLWLAAVPRERTVTPRSVTALMATLAVLAGLLLVGGFLSGGMWVLAYWPAAALLLLALALTPAAAAEAGEVRPQPVAGLLLAGGVAFLLARVGWLA